MLKKTEINISTEIAEHRIKRLTDSVKSLTRILDTMSLSFIKTMKTVEDFHTVVEQLKRNG